MRILTRDRCIHLYFFDIIWLKLFDKGCVNISRINLHYILCKKRMRFLI